MKRISGKEFWEFGYLQEVNRQLLHPLGLALEVIVNEENGEVEIGGVWDIRDDPEGIIFGETEIDKNKTERVKKELDKRAKIREKALGFVIQE